MNEGSRRFAVSRPTLYKLLARYQEKGPEGLLNRPHGGHNRVPEEVVEAILSDRGSQFWATTPGAKAATVYELVCQLLGIRPIFACKARTKGKAEKLIQYLAVTVPVSDYWLPALAPGAMLDDQVRGSSRIGVAQVEPGGHRATEAGGVYAVPVPVPRERNPAAH